MREPVILPGKAEVIAIVEAELAKAEKYSEGALNNELKNMWENEAIRFETYLRDFTAAPEHLFSESIMFFHADSLEEFNLKFSIRSVWVEFSGHYDEKGMMRSRFHNFVPTHYMSNFTFPEGKGVIVNIFEGDVTPF